MVPPTPLARPAPRTSWCLRSLLRRFKTDFYTVLRMDKLNPKAHTVDGALAYRTHVRAGLGRFANPTPVGSPLNA